MLTLSYLILARLIQGKLVYFSDKIGKLGLRITYLVCNHLPYSHLKVVLFHKCILLVSILGSSHLV